MDYNYTMDFIDELKNEISDLKQMVEDLQNEQ